MNLSLLDNYIQKENSVPVYKQSTPIAMNSRPIYQDSSFKYSSQKKKILTWKFWHTNPFTKFITEVITVLGQQVIVTSRPFSTKFPQDLIHLKD
jgi:hypothetical protein